MTKRKADRRGRPRKPDDCKRVELLQIRLTRDERELLEAYAEESCETVSSFCRGRIFAS